MKRKSKGSVTASIALFITSGIMASFLGVRQYDRSTTEIGWITSAPLQAGQTITAGNLKTAKVKQDRIGINDPRQLVGKTVTVNKPAGDTFRTGDVRQPKPKARSTLAAHIPTGRVLFSLKLGAQTTLPFSQLSAGDRLDILVRGRQGVRTAATNVQLIGVMQARGSGSANASQDGKITSLLPQRSAKADAASSGATLVLAVDPDHVYPLAQVGAHEVVNLVLHSAHDVAAGRAVTVTPARADRAVEVVAGLSRTTTYVRR